MNRDSEVAMCMHTVTTHTRERCGNVRAFGIIIQLFKSTW